jgi:hypothetical protein
MNNFLLKFADEARAQDLISCPDGTMADPSIGCVQTPGSIVNPESGLLEIILKFSSGLMLFLAGVATMTLIYGAIRYAMAAGDENQIKTAKRIMIWSIVGLVVGLLASYVVQLVIGIVG